MSTVKTIDVAIRAITEAFEAGLYRSAAEMKKLDAAAGALSGRFDKLAEDLLQGKVTSDQYSDKLQALMADSRAVQAGFMGMRDATAKAEQAIREATTETERYERELAELNALLKVGALTTDQHARAIAHATERYRANIPTAEAVEQKTSLMSAAFSRLVPVVDVAQLAFRGFALASRVVHAAIDGVRSKLEEIDAASKAAASIGIATDELMRMRFAIGEVAGVSAEGVDTMLTKMIRTLAEGSKKTATQLQYMGLTLSSLRSMTPEQAFMTLTDAISKMEGQGAKAAAAVAFFGKSGASLLPIFNDAGAALREAAEFADKFGLTVKSIDGATVETANDTLARTVKILDGLYTQIAVEIAPSLIGLGRTIIVMANDGNSSLHELVKTFQYFGLVVSSAIDMLREFATGTVLPGGLGKLTNLVLGLGDALEQASGKPATFSEVFRREMEKVQDEISKMSVSRKAPIGTATAEPDSEVESVGKAMEERNATLERFNALLMKSLSPQEKYLEDLRQINNLHASGLIDLEKRNALLTSITKTAMQPQADAMAKAAEEMAKRQEALRARGADIRKSVETPFEKFTSKIAELDKLRRAGAIDTDTFQRAFAAARNEFGATLEKTASTVFEAVQPPAAVERGTQEAFSAFQRNRDAKTKDDKQLEEARKARVALETLVKRGVILAKAMI